MAGLDTDPLEQAQRSHDGQARCRVCTDASASADHQWCASVSGLVCSSCCHRILLGQLGHMMAVAMGAVAASEGPAEEMSPCASCERGRAWLEQNSLGLTDSRRMPS